MAHFAKLNEENIVVQVIKVNNNELLVDGNESEAQGIKFLNATYKVNNITWKQTSYNGNIRKNFAGIGYTYDETRDAFIPPKPFNSWVLNETTCLWEEPIPEPELTEDEISNGNYYDWNESTTTWDLI
tara:strand:- start:79 stop:462 length:384 start_codon:yes stop_codon:yes gene_type:complete